MGLISFDHNFEYQIKQRDCLKFCEWAEPIFRYLPIFVWYRNFLSISNRYGLYRLLFLLYSLDTSYVYIDIRHHMIYNTTNKRYDV